MVDSDETTSAGKRELAAIETVLNMPSRDNGPPMQHVFGAKAGEKIMRANDAPPTLRWSEKTRGKQPDAIGVRTDGSFDAAEAKGLGNMAEGITQLTEAHRAMTARDPGRVMNSATLVIPAEGELAPGFRLKQDPKGGLPILERCIDADNNKYGAVVIGGKTGKGGAGEPVIPPDKSVTPQEKSQTPVPVRVLRIGPAR
jgi:hypothetical protein